MDYLQRAADLVRDQASRLREQKGPVDSRLIEPRDEWSVRSVRDRETGKEVLAVHFEEAIRRVLLEQFERGKAEGRAALADALRSEMVAFVNGAGNYDRFREHFTWEDMPAAQRGAEFLMAHIREWLEG